MHSFKTLIIEDEPAQRKELEWLVSRETSLELAGTADSVEKSIALINQTAPDLVLMDIQLTDGTAFDILHHFPQPAFRIIFITAFGHYAIKAIRFGALDYLMKPVDQQEFAQAIQRLKLQHDPYFSERIGIMKQMGQPEKPTDMNAQICIPSIDSLQLARLDDILYLEGEGAYTKIHFRQGKKLTASKPLKHYEELLPGDFFIRPHQSYIVNRNRIDRYLKTGILVMEDQSEVPVATRRKEYVVNLLTTHR